MCKPLCNKSYRIWLLFSSFRFGFFLSSSSSFSSFLTWLVDVRVQQMPQILLFTFARRTHTHTACGRLRCLSRTTATTKSATKSSDKCIPQHPENKIYDVLPEQTKAKCHHRAAESNRTKRLRYEIETKKKEKNQRKIK